MPTHVEFQKRSCRLRSVLGLLLLFLLVCLDLHCPFLEPLVGFLRFFLELVLKFLELMRDLASRSGPHVRLGNPEALLAYLLTAPEGSRYTSAQYELSANVHQ